MMQVQMLKLAQILSVYTKNCWRPGLCPGPHSNCCLSLYLNIAGVRQGPEKCFWGCGKFWKSPGIFCNQESGTRVYRELLFCNKPSERQAKGSMTL